MWAGHWHPGRVSGHGSAAGGGLGETLQPQHREAGGNVPWIHSPNLTLPHFKQCQNQLQVEEMESPEQTPVSSTGKGTTAPKKKAAAGFKVPGWCSVGSGAPAGSYPDLWHQDSTKPSSRKACRHGFGRCASILPLGCFCSITAQRAQLDVALLQNRAHPPYAQGAEAHTRCPMCSVKAKAVY